MGKRMYKDWREEQKRKEEEKARLAAMSNFEKFAIWLDNLWKNLTRKMR